MLSISSAPPQPPAPGGQQFLVSPITGEKVPADKLQEHMRHGNNNNNNINTNVSFYQECQLCL